ncbi:nuclear transport factor 2 family protein [Pseudovibrio sp. Tun.PSC04-5.I4]|uniref:nuclear transport factor 2 family protein n=1 Tax=Pseudovibrio sp. Tun.PSC04-5.I4 TaxID=1798213 RepID=UPI00087E9F5A|nr:nuclear transport factor 2 family protein [Pseudovibrio sp. Tun.PSC04-5.I4]SDR21085.1 SnoaL-like domain-containing protein [Pseudovibrio sp. Tun.PSC04-5.I4]
MSKVETLLQNWIASAEAKDVKKVTALLAPEVVVYSPFLENEVKGIREVMAVFSAFSQVTKDFHYGRYWIRGGSAVLEFKARVGDADIHAADIVEFNEKGQIVRFDILGRPASSLTKLGEAVKGYLDTLPNTLKAPEALLKN